MAEIRPKVEANGKSATADAEPLPRPPKSGEPGYRTPKERKLQASLTAAYEGLGVGVSLLGVQLQDEGIAQTGVKINGMADITADAWLELAKENPKIMETLIRLTEASKMGVLVGCHIAMIVPFLVNRGMVPAHVGGMVMMATDRPSEESVNGSH